MNFEHLSCASLESYEHPDYYHRTLHHASKLDSNQVLSAVHLQDDTTAQRSAFQAKARSALQLAYLAEYTGGG